MRNFLKAAMVAVFVLSVGAAWAGTPATVDIYSNNDMAPTSLGAVLYTDGATKTWGTGLTTPVEAYGEAVSLTINNATTLTIGTTAADDTVASGAIMNIEVIGDITLGDASGAGNLNIGFSGGSHGVNVTADNFYLVNGAATLEEFGYLDVNTFVLDYIGASGSSTFTMIDGSSMVVNGDGDPNYFDFSIGGTAGDATFSMGDNELFVDGLVGIGNFGPTPGAGTAKFEFDEDSDVIFTEGMVLADGGVLQGTGATGVATIWVGDDDGTDFTAGDVWMQGGATIAGLGTEGLAILDVQGNDAVGNESLSIFYVSGEGNIVHGLVSFGSGNTAAAYKGYMDMQVGGFDQNGILYETSLQIGNGATGTADQEGHLWVRDYTQINGIVETGVVDMSGFDDAANAVIHVVGDSFEIRGGVFGVSAVFESDTAEDVNVNGATWKNWDDQFAIIEGTGRHGPTSAAQFFQGRDDVTLNSEQEFKIDKNAAITLVYGDSVYKDLDVFIHEEGNVFFAVFEDPDFRIYDNADAIGGAIYLRAGDEFLGSTITIVNASNVKFSLGLLRNKGDVIATSIGSDGIYKLIDATLVNNDYVSDPINAPEFGFSGMFGDFEVGFSTPDRDVYGITSYMSNGVAFDGEIADANLAWDVIRETYGGRIQLGLSDLAYRASLDNDITTVTGPLSELAPTSNFGPEWDSYNLNMANLLDIAQGVADRSLMALQNGSAAFGVNQVSASTAQSHIQVGLNRSNDIRKLNTLVRNSVAGGDAYASSIMNQCYTNRFWAGGFGLWENADMRRDFDGYKYKSAGIAVGYDRMIGSNFIVGGSFAATFGDYEDKSALAHNSDIDSYSFNLYTTYTHQSGFFATLFGGYTYSDNDINELRLSSGGNKLWNTASYHTNSWALGGKLGYDWKPAERFTVTPSAGITWINARSSAHTEYLGGVAAVDYSRMKTNQTYLPIELAFGYDAFASSTSRLNIALNLGYAYNFNNDPIKGNVLVRGIAGLPDDGPYAAVSRAPGNHTFTIGAGLRYTAGRFDIGAKYDYARKAKMDSHRLYGTVGISF